MAKKKKCMNVNKCLVCFIEVVNSNNCIFSDYLLRVRVYDCIWDEEGNL